MKKQLILALICCSNFLFAQQIVVNSPTDPESALSAEDLLNQVLINSNTCASATLELIQENPAGTTTRTERSWGYFKRGTSNFPFEEGIILSSGFAVNAEGPNNIDNISNNGTGWGGDNDLKQILDAQNGGNAAVNNATVFQFKFTPVTNSISFQFIFASDEYENDQECASGGQFRDGFAFLIKGPGLPNDSGTTFGGTNMASIPGTNVSVNTFSIHRNTFNCGGENQGTNYFPNLYVSNSGANNQNEIQFDGMTSVLTAQTSLLTPGQEYTLKMVIGDRGDSGYDSAVFLASGNFNLGGDLGPDQTIASGSPGCDGNAITLNGTAGVGATYRWFRNGVEITGETGPTYDATTDGTYKVEINFSGGACIVEDEIEVEFITPPTANTPNDLRLCDDDGDGIRNDFDLRLNNPVVFGAQDPTNLVISYHLTQADADNNANPITPNPFTNTVPNEQTLFVRLQSTLNTSCYDTNSFKVYVDNAVANAPNDLTLCDDDADGIRSDFDLTLNDALILGGQNAADYTITYHLSQAHADSGTNPLASPFTNGTPNMQQIFARIQHNATVPACFSTTSFNVIVNPLPLIAPITPLQLCDNDDDGNATNGIVQTFDLNSKIPEILNGQTGISVTFHSSLTDAQNNTGALTSPFTNTVPNTQQIFVRLENTTTNCSDTTSFNVVVNPLPQISNATLEQCDYIGDTLDGISLLNLTQAYDDITNTTPGLTLNYYFDAALTMPIVDPVNFTNTVPFNQTIYVEVIDENVTPNCTANNVAQLALIIRATSIAAYPNIAPVCPELNLNYGFIDFDTQRILIKNTFFPSTPVDIAFYLSATDAATETNPQINTSQIPVGIHTIFTRIETDNDCEGIGTFTVEVHQAPIRNTISDFDVCENETVLLSDRDTEALQGQNPNVIVSYHSSFDDARDNLNPIDPNTGLTSLVSQTVHVRLFDTATGCFSIVDFDIRVYPLPVVNNPDPIAICGDVTGTFDLTIRIPQITGGNNALQVFFYASLADLNANNPILNPNAYVSPSAVIYVNVFDPTNNNCSQQPNPLLITVLSIPGQVNDPTPIEICDDSGFGVFDLRSREVEMAGTTDIATIEYKYYESFADAQANNSNVIATPFAFTNTIQNQQSVFIRLNSRNHIDSETGIACFRIVELQLFVRPFPDFELSEEPYIICVDENDVVVSSPTVDTGLNPLDYTFQWYTDINAVPGNEILGEINATFQPVLPGNYSVLVTNTTNAAACVTVKNFTAQNSYIPSSITTNPEILLGLEIDNNSIEAIATPASPDYLYKIDGSAWQTSPIFNNLIGGQYTLSVKNRYGCGDAISTQFIIIDYPKFVTPNGDGFNDTWNIRGIESIQPATIYIFDRYGKLLKQVDPNGLGWDGTYNGNQAPATDYWFRLIYTFNGVEREFGSHFTLKR